MPTLFQRILGDAFSRLPPRVRMLHEAQATRVYQGRADIERGRGWIARIFSAAISLPVAGTRVPLDVTIAIVPAGENWIRNFEGRLMSSRLRQSAEWLRERLGLATFDFSLSVDDGVLIWRVHSIRVLGIPLPAMWFDRVVAREFEQNGRYGFDVRAELPLIGFLVHYAGWLDVD
jgi:hypothetical protein